MRLVSLAFLVAWIAPELARGQDQVESKFAMSKAVACKRVDGFEDYVTLPAASLTSEDKLKVYFRPLHFKVEKVEQPGQARAVYRAKFTEDGRVRRKGEKTVLSKEDKLLEHEATFDTPDYQIYLVNNIGLKNLPPGEYEFEIILHDMLDEGVTARQILPFTVVAPPKIDEPDTPKKATGSSEVPRAKAKTKAKPKTAG